MIPYEIYKTLHITGVLFMVAGFGAYAMLRAAKVDDETMKPFKRTLAIVHGLALFIIIVGGFGTAARMGMLQAGLPVWIIIKNVFWLVLGGSLVALARAKNQGKVLFYSLPAVTAAAAAVAIYKPFMG
jgi:hypothetical protein